MNVIMENISWLAPEIFLFIVITFLLGYGVIYGKLSGVIKQQQKLTWICIITLVLTGLLTLTTIEYTYASSEILNISSGLMKVDLQTQVTKLILLIGSTGILLYSFGQYTTKMLVEFEYAILILIATLGMLLIVSTADLIILYLSIELISLTLYILATINKSGQFSTESGLKYFILGALSSGLLLFGMALIYGTTGETGFTQIGNILNYIGEGNLGIQVGSLFIIIALLFKLAAAPFHMWAPDVYDGAPTIITAFFAIVPKIAILYTLINLVFGPLLAIFVNIQPIIFISAILSLLVGSITGLNQSKFKRLLAYSAIGHMGFMLIGIGTGSLLSLQATFLYIILYAIMSFNTFGCVLAIYRNKANNYITEISGLSRTYPLLALTLTIGLLSIAGIPPLAGFYSKYFILLSAVNSGYIVLALFAIGTSIVSCFFYLRIIKWIYFKDTEDFYMKEIAEVSSISTIKVDTQKSIILGITTYIILTFLIYPNPLLMLTFDSISYSLI